MRKNVQQFWGNNTDPMHSLKSVFSPKQAATNVFFDDKSGTNPMLSNIKSRRSLKFPSHITTSSVLSPHVTEPEN